MTATPPTTERVPVSCFIRTCNEERRIGEVVSTALNLVSEVIVIDSGSKDKTVEIATAAGAKVISHPWTGNGHQKRVGEDHCQQEWLLDLDADEVLSPELIEEIRKLFRQGDPPGDVYQLLLTLVDPRGRVWYGSDDSYRSKLYRKSKIRMPAHASWDQLEIPETLTVKQLKSALLHYCFTSMGQLLVKQEAGMSRRVKGMKPRSRMSLLSRIYLGFPLYFLKYFFLRGLWRQGPYGMAYSFVCSVSRWIRDVKLYERDYFQKPILTK